MITTFYPPLNTQENNNFKIFLAGSIEMNKCEDWQKNTEKILIDTLNNVNIDIYNPRRDFFNFEQGSPEFYEQVNWELDHLEKCNLILLVLLNNTISPISLLELGIFSKSKKIIVICGNDYFRKYNVKIVCERNNIPYFEDFDEGVKHCINIIKNKTL